jgi:signal transduction histidine kinase
MSDLQQSRERLVLAREEERRRLRRDLHDELAPAIAALALTGGAVEEVMTTNPEAALSLLRKLNSAMRATVGDIRRLVYELRPPVLDELGLADAIRERCSHYSTHTHLSVTADIPEPLPELPAAVEVAAYRIALEALMNVVRHAQARSCTVRVRAGESLEIVVSDDGVGLSAQSRPGVGLRSMRERAEELGGACVVDSPPEGGTTVRTSLPIAVYMLNDLCPPHEEHSSEDERPALSATDS